MCGFSFDYWCSDLGDPDTIYFHFFDVTFSVNKCYYLLHSKCFRSLFLSFRVFKCFFFSKLLLLPVVSLDIKYRPQKNGKCISPTYSTSVLSLAKTNIAHIWKSKNTVIQIKPNSYFAGNSRPISSQRVVDVTSCELVVLLFLLRRRRVMEHKVGLTVTVYTNVTGMFYSSE